FRKRSLVKSSPSELMGDAMVTTEQVRLRPAEQAEGSPCHLRALELQMHFKIHSQGMKNLNGDVLAIWYTKERMQEGTDLFTGLGVLVDTYPNEEKHLEAQKMRYTTRTQYCIVVTAVSFTCSPSLSLFSVPHSFIFSHLPTEDLPLCVGDGVCTAMLRNHNHNTVIFIRYVRCRDCLDIPGVRLPQGYYFGSSAITGDLSDNHDVISLRLYQLTVLRSETAPCHYCHLNCLPFLSILTFFLSFALSVGENEEGWSNIAMFFTILFSMLGCFLLILVGLIVYSHWNKNRQTLLLRGREACHHNLYYCRLRTKLH
uniref:L-type lectin-like domain-containing protein n=1 Tax=Oncorhynchus tshawytscha TaxID=74940 RepID=A0AAZ3PNI3_ONCTS